MKIRVTLRRQEQLPINVEITADSTATVGDVAAALASGDPQEPGPLLDPKQWTLRVVETDGLRVVRTLDPQTFVQDSSLRSGLTIEPVPYSVEVKERSQQAAIVQVLTGPEQGREFSVPFGSTTVGRSRRCDITLTDPAVSKQHLRINIGDSVDLHDLNSANGVFVADQRVQRLSIGSGEVITVGSTQLRVVRTREVQSEGGGTVEIKYLRTPRVVPRVKAEKVALPNVPRPPAPQRFPWMMVIAPLIMGSAMFAMTKQPYMLLFIFMSPIMMLGSWSEGRRRSKEEYQKQVKIFEEGSVRAEREMSDLFQRERAVRKAQYPALAELYQGIIDLGAALWSRRREHEEFLRLRLGIGVDTPDSTFEPGMDRDGEREYMDRLEALKSRFATIDDVPVTASLRQDGAIGICGSRDVADGFALGLVAQLVALHSPADVQIACLTSTGRLETWKWLEWLPHARQAAAGLGDLQLAADAATAGRLLARLEELALRRGRGDSMPRPRGAVSRIHEGEDPSQPTSLVVIVDEPLVDMSRLQLLLELGPDAGIYFIWVCEHHLQMPAACRTFINLSEGGVTAGFVRRAVAQAGLEVEGLTDTQVIALGRLLASVTDSSIVSQDSSSLPQSVSYISLVGHELADDANAVISRWRENSSIIDRDGLPQPLERSLSLSALVGQGADSPFALDLRAHGPHALVGGTTGAGKSEFLQAWVLGMAQSLSPDRVTFLFVDYKGGSAFASCTNLPHTVGLVTDLSPYLVRRALTSLRAELRRREHLLNEKGMKDLVSLEKSGDPDCPPALVIVIDEFAALVGEVPEFVDGVVDVAQRGRSLGLHLIMATQRPAGVIRDNLRANTNLRVALRMADESDSTDVLGDAMAAHFSPSIPGRAAAKLGAGRIIPFQSAYPGARTAQEQQHAEVTVTELKFGPVTQWKIPHPPRPTAEVDQDIERVVRTLSAAARMANIRAPRKPWLEELAPAYNLLELRQRTDRELVLGVVDLPDLQDQQVEYFRPEQDGNIGFYGAGGSGKSTALRTLATAAGITPRSGPVWVYGLDYGGGALKMLETMPHVGSIIDGDDVDRTVRLLEKLETVLKRRAERFSEVNASNLTEFRRISEDQSTPRYLVLIDGLMAMKSQMDKDVVMSALFDRIMRLVGEGRSVGIHFAISVERPIGVPQSIVSALGRKVILRHTDSDQYSYFNLPRDILNEKSPAGRAIQVGNPNELQIAMVSNNVNMVAQAQVLNELAERMTRALDSAGYAPCPQIRSLDDEIPLHTLDLVHEGMPLLGVSAATLKPLTFTPQGAFLLAGPPQSGRTNALRVMARSLRAWDQNVVRVLLAEKRSPATKDDVWDSVAVGRMEIRAMLSKLEETLDTVIEDGPPLVALFIEGYTGFLGSSLEDQLLPAVKAAKENGHFVVAEADIDKCGSSWDFISVVRNQRTGLLLQPDYTDGEQVMRIPLTRMEVRNLPVGRGFSMSSGKAHKVQVPLI